MQTRREGKHLPDLVLDAFRRPRRCTLVSPSGNGCVDLSVKERWGDAVSLMSGISSPERSIGSVRGVLVGPFTK